MTYKPYDDGAKKAYASAVRVREGWLKKWPTSPKRGRWLAEIQVCRDQLKSLDRRAP